MMKEVKTAQQQVYAVKENMSNCIAFAIPDSKLCLGGSDALSESNGDSAGGTGGSNPEIYGWWIRLYPQKRRE